MLQMNVVASPSGSSGPRRPAVLTDVVNYIFMCGWSGWSNSVCSKQGRAVLICCMGGVGVMAETCAWSGHMKAASGMILLSAIYSLWSHIPSLSTTNCMGTVKPNTSKHNTVPAHSLTLPRDLSPADMLVHSVQHYHASKMSAWSVAK